MPVSQPKQALIVNYHYCAPEGRAIPGFTGITPESLNAQLATLTARLEPFAVDELPFDMRDKADAVGCLLSFDDGVRDVLVHALPVVRRYAIPAIIFCCALPYVESRVLNVQKTHLLQGRWGWQGFRAKFLSVLNDDPEGAQRQDVKSLGLDRMYRYDDPETAGFKRLLNVELPYPVTDRILDRLFEDEFGPQRDIAARIYMSLDDILRCVDEGVTVGLHTYSHCMLSRLSKDEQAAELDASLALFRDRLGLDVNTLSYPYGIKGSWNNDTKELAAQRNMRAAFTLGRSIYSADLHRDPMEIPRFDVNDVFHRDGTIKIDL